MTLLNLACNPPLLQTVLNPGTEKDRVEFLNKMISQLSSDLMHASKVLDNFTQYGVFRHIRCVYLAAVTV